MQINYQSIRKGIQEINDYYDTLTNTSKHNYITNFFNTVVNRSINDYMKDNNYGLLKRGWLIFISWFGAGIIGKFKSEVKKFEKETHEHLNDIFKKAGRQREQDQKAAGSVQVVGQKEEPREPTQARAEKVAHVKLMTYNVLATGATKSNVNHDWDILRLEGYIDTSKVKSSQNEEEILRRIDDIARNVLNAKPDLVCLQEVDENSLNVLQQSLGQTYDFKTVGYHVKVNGRKFGNIILVKKNSGIIVRAEHVIEYHPVENEKRKHVAVALTLPGDHKMNLICSHFLYSTDADKDKNAAEISVVLSQIEALEKSASFSDRDITVITGDYNRDARNTEEGIRDAEIPIGSGMAVFGDKGYTRVSLPKNPADRQDLEVVDINDKKDTVVTANKIYDWFYYRVHNSTTHTFTFSPMRSSPLGRPSDHPPVTTVVKFG